MEMSQLWSKLGNNEKFQYFTWCLISIKKYYGQFTLPLHNNALLHFVWTYLLLRYLRPDLYV